MIFLKTLKTDCSYIVCWGCVFVGDLKIPLLSKCDMAFIEPMHCNKPNVHYYQRHVSSLVLYAVLHHVMKRLSGIRGIMLDCQLVGPSVEPCWICVHLCQGHVIKITVIIKCLFSLTHWGRVMHICVSKLTITGSDNGLSPSRRQAIIWTNAGILLIGTLGTNFSEILIEIHPFSFKKIGLNVSSAKWRPFCLGLNVLSWGTSRTWKHAANMPTSLYAIMIIADVLVPGHQQLPWWLTCHLTDKWIISLNRGPFY